MTEARVSETKTKPKTETITWHAVDELLPEVCVDVLVVNLQLRRWTTAYWDGEDWRTERGIDVEPQPTHWTDISGP